MFFIWALLFLTPVFGWPAPEKINGTIPFNTHSTLDPALIRRASDDKLFLYNSGMKEIWTADSLYGPWIKYSGNASVGNGGPALYNVNETYYRFYKSRDPGSWVDHGAIDIPWSENYNILDHSFQVAEGQNLISFGSYYTGIYQVPLADPPLQLAPGANSSIVHLARNQSSLPHGPADPIEASYQFPYGDYYYLFFSSGQCCGNENPTSPDFWRGAGDVYKIMVCRSEDPRKGYVDQDGKDCLESGGTIILGSHGKIWAPGGQGVLNDTEAEGPIVYYHYLPFNTTTKKVEARYLLGWNKLNFESGWPVVV